MWLLDTRAGPTQVASPRAPPTIISMWLVIINPISKLALTLAPVAMAVEVRRHQLGWWCRGMCPSTD